MGTSPQRRYRLKARAEAASRTRQRILAAAKTEFSTVTGRPPSVERVAERAGVARTTVYAQFGSRLGLIEAVVMEAVRHGGLPDIIKASFDPDARQAVLSTVRFGTQLWGKDARLYTNIFALAAIDADIRSLVELNEGNRRRDIERLVHRAAEQRVLRNHLTIGDAVDALLLLTSFPTFQQLHRGGRPVGKVAEILVTIVTGALLAE